MFDYLSTIERKNPLGAIEAYRRAFGPGDGCELFLKSVNGRHRADRRAEVEAAAEGRPDIVLCDRAVSAQERDELVATCDVYLSLHRSEGFGLTLAEAMAACKPVVATAFGGNTDFMTAANSYLVGYEPRLVGDGVEHYPAGATWAEPDVAQAAIQLRAVFDDRMRAQARAERGRSDVEAMLAPQVVGASMRDHLEALQDAGASHRTRPLARWSRVR
jgi:glycosyltransferase involved in cell wall biosynthesis